MASLLKRIFRRAPKEKLDESLLGPSSAAKERAKRWDELPRFYRYRQMRDDATVGLGLAAVKGPIVSVPWEIECQPLDDSDAARAQADEIKDWLGNRLAVKWTTLAQMALNMIDFGRMAVEKEYFLGDDGLYDVKFRDYEPEDTTPLKDENGDFAGIKYRGQELSKDRVMLFVNDKEFGDLNGRSRLRRIDKKWWYAENCYELLNRYLERQSGPSTKSRAPNVKRRDAAGVEYDPMAKMHDAAKDIRSGGDVALPSERDAKGNYVYDLEYLSTDQRAPMFIGAVEFYEKMKLRGLLVPERVATQDASTGAYGMSETHKDTFMSTEGMVLDNISGVLNVDLLDQWVTANWGAGAPRAYLRTKGLSKEIEALVEKVFMGVAQSYPQALAAIVDLVAWCESHEIPLVADAREQLKKIQANAVMGTVPTSGTVPASVRLKDASDPAAAEPPDLIAEITARYGPKAAAFFEKLRARVGATHASPGQAGAGGSGRPFRGDA